VAARPRRTGTAAPRRSRPAAQDDAPSRFRRIAREELAGVAPMPALRALRELESLRTSFGADASARKWELLWHVQAGELPGADDLVRFHELLGFMAAYPDDPPVELAARLFLLAFASRYAGELKRYSTRLENSGIAGTPIRFRFFAPTARWLARRWPDQLTIDWSDFDNADRLAELMPQLAHPAEIPALDEWDLTLRQWIDRMRGKRETDAAWVIRAFGGLAVEDPLRETLYDAVDLPVRLAPGPDSPSRTLAHWPVPGIHYQTRPLARERPDLHRAVLARPRAVRVLTEKEGSHLVDLARGAMVTRERDLDAFTYADPLDVRLVDFGDGLQFAALGVIPERRLLLESVYGFLTIKNGVPIGYVLTSALYGSSELAYNVFDNYRGVEAAAVYAKVLAMARFLFGSDTFTIVPYQLGDDNHEAIESGAWWFYRKLGFRPRDPGVVRLAAREQALMKRRPAHRTSAATLRRLARAPLFWHDGPGRSDVIGHLPLANVGLAVADWLAKRFPRDRTDALGICADAAAARLDLQRLARWSAGERLAWSRWAPLLLLLPGIERWSAAERRALVEVVRAKGGRRESDFVRRFDAHRKLRRALVRVMAGAGPD
jgi:hypothetical protein